MNAGSLKHRIIIQQQSNVQDSTGQQSNEWTEVNKIWASITPLTGREYFSAQQINSEITTKIVIRYRSGLTPDMRIKYGNRIFEILSVINAKEQNIELHLMCKEVM